MLTGVALVAHTTLICSRNSIHRSLVYSQKYPISRSAILSFSHFVIGWRGEVGTSCLLCLRSSELFRGSDRPGWEQFISQWPFKLGARPATFSLTTQAGPLRARTTQRSSPSACQLRHRDLGINGQLCCPDTANPINTRRYCDGPGLSAKRIEHELCIACCETPLLCLQL